MQLQENCYFGGTVQFASAVLQANAISDVNINTPSAGSGISATKVMHRFRATRGQSGNAVSETVPIHVVQGIVAKVNYCKAGSITIAAGSGSVTVDLKKNGTSVLTAVITLNSSSVARTEQAAAIAAGGLTMTAGDWLELVITAGSATLPTGLFVDVEIEESPS